MELSLVSHLHGDGDLLEAWIRHYLRLGVSSFHLIVHGPREENDLLYLLKEVYPIHIESEYDGPFATEEKRFRLNCLLKRLCGRWLLLVDSDEFAELPYRTISSTVRMLRLTRTTALPAPMLQHLTPDGCLDTPATIEDPFHVLPMCSIDLYRRMGVDAAVNKYPLFYCGSHTELSDGGNHFCQAGNIASPWLRGVTHHFKFRRSVIRRIEDRIRSGHSWHHESVRFLQYLEGHSNRLPLEAAFPYSRDELFRRGLLRKLAPASVLRQLLLRKTARDRDPVSHPGECV
jgi:Glycosyl transferase family 2